MYQDTTIKYDVQVTKLYHILIIRIWVFVSCVSGERSVYHYCWKAGILMLQMSQWNEY